MEKVPKIIYNYNSFKNFSEFCLNKIGGILWFLGKNIFMFILIFILLEIIFAEFLFYKYVFSVKIEEPQVVGELTEFHGNEYQLFLNKKQLRKKIINDLSLREIYVDPFTFSDQQP